MSAQELITEHLDLWTEAVTKKSTSGRGSNGKIELTGIKKLRELILELAVRGRLVEQDTSEDPANLILERLDSATKKSKEGFRVPSGTSQLSLPTGWAFFRVGDYLNFQYGKSLPAKQRDDSGSIEVYGSNGVVGFHSEALTKEACIVIGRKGSAGALNKAIGPSWTTDVAYYVQPPEGFDFEFTYLMLQSLRLDKLGKGIKPGVNRNEAYELIASLPPLKEQHRIVQKVDELMVLCDQLEQQTNDQLTAHETLVDTLLGTLTQSENITELAENWTRLATHFDTLFTTEQSIDKLKQSILQLAVMGRLVEQDAEDESASELLKRIDGHQEKLFSSGKIKKSKKLPLVSEEEHYFDLPLNWCWTRLGILFDSIMSGGTPSKSQSRFWGGDIPWASVKDLGKSKHLENTQDYITEEGLRAGSKIADIGDVLICTRMGLGKVAICSKPTAFNQDLKAVKITPLISLDYFFLAYTTLDITGTGTTVAGITQDKLLNYVIGLPPVEEQHRIVKKVDELMTLCDQLKERLNQASETRCQLAEAVVNGALN